MQNGQDFARLKHHYSKMCLAVDPMQVLKRRHGKRSSQDELIVLCKNVRQDGDENRY